MGDHSSEGSETAKVCTDEQKPDMRPEKEDEQAHHCEVLRIQNLSQVDPAGIDRRNMLLPGEVLE
jgi:hypothetical protein